MNIEIKCINTDCPMKKECQRYAMPRLNAEMLFALFMYDENDGCEYYWDKNLPDPCTTCGGQLIHYDGCFKNN
jgi:hypothetical protein